MIPLRPVGVPSRPSTTITPSPAGIVAPESEKPRAVVGLLETIKPASPAAPPDAPFIVAPSTLNWKPAISPSLD